MEGKAGKVKCGVIVLASGQGKRMGTALPKQYLLLKGKPILAYTLQAFQESPLIDEILLTVGEDEIDFCKNNIIAPYHFNKVRKIVVGGKERYDSVMAGLDQVEDWDLVMIHDGARPFVDQETLKRIYQEGLQYKACVAAVPSKDTVRIGDEKQMAVETLDRSKVWNIQTPQAFEQGLIKEAYRRFKSAGGPGVTDDAMVVEMMMKKAVRLTLGDYRNIKITTPEDLLLGEKILEEKA